MNPHSTKTIRYYLYARKSSESEDKQVASIGSQIEELKDFAKQYSLKILDTRTEEKSAKAPGRPVFNQMLQDIHDGKAEGILCWKLDRLARNPVDGGNITWMLQQGKLHHIQTFQRGYSPTDNVIMMSVEFGMANQFILDLSLNTKRGQRNKAQNGWLPTKAPLGYLNNKYNTPDNPPIYKDPQKFELVKKLWDILLNKKCTLDNLYIIANEMGLISYTTKAYGRSSFYRLFRNPFYYGYVEWNGQKYEGKHEAMITKTEFDLAQRIIDGRAHTCPKKHVFAFTGLMRCGECGAAITAENQEKHQKNGNVHRYTYYHCTKRINRHCTQKPIRAPELESQILNKLANVQIPMEFHEWAIKYLREEYDKDIANQDGISQAHQKCLNDCSKRLDTLLNLRINGEITAEEFNSKKEQIVKEKDKYEDLLKNKNKQQPSWLDKAEELFSIVNIAQNRFNQGGLEAKRDILSRFGSNLSLRNRILEISHEEGLGMFLDVAPEVQAFHARFEPTQPFMSQRDWEDLYAKNEKWGE